tara:strand:+ start:75 stop:1214 length:1140 start_codon:yes stop_codon:yes gene_type:complete
MKKNFFLLLITLIFLFIFLYLGFFFYLKNIHGFNNLELIKNKNKISFYEKYSKRLHHLRHYLDKKIDFKKTETLLFSESEQNDINNKMSILFLGDSWIEQMLVYQQSNNYIENYFKKNKINYYNAGISSYAPTVMNIQYQILKDDFKLKPKMVVLYIDQTDFGDEMCRYKQNKEFVNGKLYGVKDYFFTPRLIAMSKIENKYKISFLKDLAQFNFYIKQKISLLTNKFQKIFKNNKNIYGCNSNNILSYLINPTASSVEYFRNSTKDLVDLLNNDSQIEQILIVTFPHRNHLNHVSNANDYGDYNYSVEDAVDYYILNNVSEKITHLKFSKYLNKNTELINEKSFIQMDKFSHLTENAHSKIFTKKIIDEIDKILANSY